MTDRKHKAIVDLKRSLLLWFRRGQDGDCDPPGLREAEYFYHNRIAPLIRGEFPEQGILDILERFLTHRPSTIYITLERFRRLWEGAHTTKEEPGRPPMVFREETSRAFPDRALKDLLDLVPGKEALFWKIKCLVGGQETNKDRPSVDGEDEQISIDSDVPVLSIRNQCLTDGEVLDQYHNFQETCKKLYKKGAYELRSHPCPKCGFPLNAWDKVCPACDLEQDKPKGTCPKCGGSGRDMLEKCPACDGTGECKHKKLEPFRLIFDNDWDVLEIATLPLCVACGVEVDRRSG